MFQMPPPESPRKAEEPVFIEGKSGDERRAVEADAELIVDHPVEADARIELGVAIEIDAPRRRSRG